MNRRDFLKNVATVAAGAATLPRIAQAGSTGAPRPPNLIFIIADDLGIGESSAYGQKKYQTPNLDRLGAEGLRSTQHYSCCICAPTRSCLMSGLHTGHTPIRWIGGFKTLNDDDVTLAKVLKQGGYTTGCFGKWGMGYQDNPGQANNQGFDEFFGQEHHIHAHFYYPYFLWKNRERYFLPENEGRKQVRYMHDEIHREALDFIRRHKDERFFAYIPYTLPHVELVVPEDSRKPFEGKWPKLPLPGLKKGYISSPDSYATFAGMVSRLDRSVGDIMRLVKELGIDNDTLIIFTSDHGPQGTDAVDYARVADFFEGKGPLRGYKGDFYEGGIRTPMMARWPGQIKPGTVTDRLSAVWDFMATLTELAGIEAPANDGISMVPTMLGRPGQQQHDFLYWENPEKELVQAVRMGNWKAVQPKGGGPFELYDLSADPRESRDRAGDRPEIMKEIRHCIVRADRTPARHYPEFPRPTVEDFVR